MKKTLLVNHTGADLKAVEAAIHRALEENAPLPEEVADLFTMRVIEVGDERRGILEWA